MEKTMSRRLRSTRPRNWSLAVAVAALIAVAAGPAWAHDASKHKKGGAGLLARKQVEALGAIDVKLLDLELVDRDGSPVRFKSEAMADRIVAIDFVYTTCTTICPILSALFAQAQDQLGARLGKEAWLVSLSLDPTRDTPKRMAAQARKFGAGPGWLWLTGEKMAVDRVLAGLDAYTADFESHASMILIGDAKRGTWTRLFGFPSPDEIVARIEELIAARQKSETTLKLGE
jgi:protein SCO1/2